MGEGGTINQSMLSFKERLIFRVMELIARGYELVTRKEEYKLSVRVFNKEYEFKKEVKK